MSVPENLDDTRRVFLIYKYGMYYRPNAAGYTNGVHSAGRYTEREAWVHSHPNGPDGPRDGISYIHEDDATKGDRETVPADTSISKAVRWFEEHGNSVFTKRAIIEKLHEFAAAPADTQGLVEAISEIHRAKDLCCDDVEPADPTLAYEAMERAETILTALQHSQPQWRCFHCGDVFHSKGEARDHFGDNEGATPACKIKAGGEKGLLEALRKAERENAEAWQAVQSETIEAVNAMYGQASRHLQQLIAVEQAGYDKGLADGREEALASLQTRDAEARLKFLRDESYDLRCFPVPTGGDDADIGWRVVGHWMAEPQERTIAEIYHDDPCAAIDAAMALSREELLKISHSNRSQDGEVQE